MNLDLKNKKVLITGGSRGIGFFTAKKFIEEGSIPIIVGRDPLNLKNASSNLNNCEHHTCDLKDRDAVQILVNRIGAVDILVNCAGAAMTQPVETVDTTAWANGINSKLWPYINIIDPMIKLMAHEGKGTIINVIGIGGKLFADNHLIGGAANSALMMATVGYAKEYAKYGLRVVGVNPAGVDSNRLDQLIKTKANLFGTTEHKARSAMLLQYPQGEFVRMDTVANTIVFLASECAYSISGTIIQIDGARSPII